MDDLESVIEQLKQELGEDKITTASDPKIKRPEKALERDMYKDFMDRNPMAGGGMLVQPRNMYAYAGIVKQGPNKGKHKYTDFYPKKTNGSFHAWFDTKKEMNEALQKRKEESGRGLTEEELTKKYKKQLKARGYKTWGEVPENIRRSISTSTTPTAIARKKELPRFKKEGLSKRLNEKTRQLLKTKKPINPKTGLPYTVKEYTDDLTQGQKMRLNMLMQGKKRTDYGSFYVPGSKKKGYYPEKDANRLINYMKIAADQQKDLPIKERTFINVFEDKDKKRFIGVQDVRKNTLYTHVDYNLGKPGAKKGTVITQHPDAEKLNDFFKVAKKFKYETPEKLLGSYFKDYERVPTYNEIYKFFTTNRNASVKTFQNNALTIQHQKLIGKVPTQNFQLLTNINNSKAAGIMRQYNRGDISKAKADYELKKIGARQEGLGILQRDITPEKGLASAKKEAVKLFKDAYAVNPDIVKDMAKKLEILGCGKAGGGRILLKTGTPGLTKCAIKGKEVLESGLTKGFKNKQQVDLAGAILKAGGGLKSAMSLRGLFGPAAIAATVAFEGGLIGFDMLTSGKTLREAFGDNLLNYALGKDYQIDPQKELFKRFKSLGYTDQQLGKIKTSLDAMNTINTATELADSYGTQLEALQESRGQPQPFMGPEDQFIADTSAQRAEQNLIDARNKLSEFNRDTYKTGEVNRLNELIESGNYGLGLDLYDDAQRAATVQRMQSRGPTSFGKFSPKFEERRVRIISENLPFGGANPAFDFPGTKEITGGTLYGFAGGGIAGLSGGIDKGPQRISMNPDSQGLSGLLKRGIKT